MSKEFGGIDNLLKPKHKREQERIRASHMAQAEARRQYRLQLDAIAAKEDLFGPDALSMEERVLKERHAAYFALKGGER